MRGQNQVSYLLVLGQRSVQGVNLAQRCLGNSIGRKFADRKEGCGWERLALCWAALNAVSNHSAWIRKNLEINVQS